MFQEVRRSIQLVMCPLPLVRNMLTLVFKPRLLCWNKVVCILKSKKHFEDLIFTFITSVQFLQLTNVSIYEIFIFLVITLLTRHTNSSHVLWHTLLWTFSDKYEYHAFLQIMSRAMNPFLGRTISVLSYQKYLCRLLSVSHA